MRYITYVSTTGEGVRDPSIDLIRSLFKQGEEYWQDKTGCGHGVFELYENNHRAAHLEITCKDGVGFRLTYTDLKLEGHERFVSVDQSCTSNDVVELHYGGEPEYIPLPMFVSSVSAQQAAVEFCKTGKRPNNIAWTPPGKLSRDPTTGEWHRPE